VNNYYKPSKRHNLLTSNVQLTKSTACRRSLPYVIRLLC